MEKYYVSNMTSSTFKARMEDPDCEIAFVPVGATEVHGMHMPLGTDMILSGHFARLFAERYNGIAYPSLPFGVSKSLDSFPGTTPVMMNTLKMYTEEVIRSIIKYGYKKIFIFQGHLGNVTVLNEIVLNLQDEFPDVKFAQADIWRFMKNNSFDIIEDEYSSKFGHAGEVCTSVMMAICGDLILDRVDNPNVKAKSSTNPDINAYIPYNEVTPTGSMGNPIKASKEKGEKLIEKYIKAVDEFVASW